MVNSRAFVIAVCLVVLVSGGFATAGALDECWQVVTQRIDLPPCLEGLQVRADAELSDALTRATASQRRLDAATGNTAASDSLRQAQLAFELYRELECTARRAQLASGTGAGDVYLACRVDLTRERVAALNEQGGAPAEQTIAGASWIAVEVLGEAVPEGVAATLDVALGGEVGGSSGCNRFFGAATIEGAKITFGPLGATKRLCGEPADTVEARFFQAIAATAGWSIDGTTLRLVDADGEPVMVMRQAPPAP